MTSKGSLGNNPIALQQDFSEVLSQIQRSRQKVFAQIIVQKMIKAGVEVIEVDVD
jgi:hypothetical protein